MLLVALWTGRPMLELVHARGHAHRFCTTHRTFEDLPAGHARSALTWPRSAEAVEAPSPLTTPAAHPRECGFVSTHRGVELPAPPGFQTLAEPRSTPARAATAPARPWTPLSVLDTAPKASPPAHA